MTEKKKKMSFSQQGPYRVVGFVQQLDGDDVADEPGPETETRDLRLNVQIRAPSVKLKGPFTDP